MLPPVFAGTSMKKIFPALCALTLPLLTGARAQTVFHETFEAAGEMENVSGVDGSVTWTSRGSRKLLSTTTDPEGLKSGNALKISRGVAYVTFPEVILEDGDSLVLSLRYRFGQPPQEKGFPIRFGLYKDPGGNPADGFAPGYWFMSNPNAEGGKSMIVVEEGTDGLMGGGTDFGGLQDLFPGAASGTAAVKMTWTLLRSPTGSVEISAQVNDDPPVTRTDPAAKVTTFNAFAISIASIENADVLVDDITLTVVRGTKK